MKFYVFLLCTILLSFVIAGCGGGGGSDAPAIPSTQYAAMTYEIVSNGAGSVFTGDNDESVVAIVVAEPIYVPDVDGAWSGLIQAYYIPMGDFGTFTPDNPATVTVTVTRTGGTVSVVANFSGQQIFHIDNAPLAVGGESTGTHVQDGDTYKYVLAPWANVASADLIHSWTATGFTDLTEPTLDITVTAGNGITATIGGRVYTGQRIGNSAYLLGTGAPDTMVILEDLGGAAGRGYQTKDAGGTPHDFDEFTIAR